MPLTRLNAVAFVARLRRLRRAMWALPVVLVPAVLTVGSQPEATGTPLPAGQWYQTDTHVHSVTGGDGFDDYGILSQAAKDKGYDALFMTDHQGASSFPIGAWTANSLVFEDTYSKWSTELTGSLSASTNALSSSPVKSGTRSLHLGGSSSSSGESFVVSDRGPNFRSGDVTLDFSVRPTRIDAGSGAYVSVSIGGDETVSEPDGYTTAAGVVSPGKSTVLVWQLGNARAPSSQPDARVITYQLPYTLDQWNTYSIDVSAALQDIPAADRPLDYNAVTQLKMATAANNGTVDAYFDSYSIKPANIVPPADEYTYRHGVVHAYDTDAFKIFEGVEMGVNRHAQRFNYSITAPSEYGPEYNNGVDGISPTQQTGYPSQLNHPGFPGGASATEVVTNLAYGADFMETRQDAGNTVMIDTWDTILEQGIQLIGTWSSDMHHVSTYDVRDRGVATNLFSPSLTFDELMHSLFEGRAYLARNTFEGQVIFNLDPSSAEPYPARYPRYIPATQTSADVHLKITGGLSSSDTIHWIVNGADVASNPAGGVSFETTRSIALSGAFTYVRAEVRDSGGNRKAMTEPIFFRDAANLPAGMGYGVDGVTTADGRQYTRVFTKGITASSWNDASESLSMTLENPVNAQSRLSVATTTAPHAVKLNGTAINAADSRDAFDAATGSSWYYDATAEVLYLKALQATASAGLVVEMSANGDAEPPTTPGGLTATAVTSRRVDLNWSASSDNVGVTGYEVWRDGTLVASLPAQGSYSDTGVQEATGYSYQVRAKDGAGNASAFSNTATATTPVARLFSDGFESGDMSLWTSSNGLTVQQSQVDSGQYAARATSTSAATYARKTLPSTQRDLYYRVRFKIISQSANTVYLLRYRTAADASIIGLFVSGSGKLGYRNDVTGVSVSSTDVTKGVWHEVQLRTLINGAAGATEVWYDGARVDALSRTESLGTADIGRVQLGENLSGTRSYDIAFDEVAVDGSFIGAGGGPDTTPPQTAIGSGPSGAVNVTSASFSFSSSESGSSFECSLDGGAYAPCESPVSYSQLAEGQHTFSVRATDSAGNTDDTPATRAWTVDLAAPDTTIDSGPSGTVSATTATFAFSSSEAGSSFECSLDAGAYTSCSSPRTYGGLAAGQHDFTVRAKDAAGNTDGTPASLTWIVSTSPAFSDGFESGTFSAWAVRTSGEGTASVQSALVNQGSFAALLSSSTAPASSAYARASLQPASDVTVSGDFQVIAEGLRGASVPLLRLLDGSGARLATLQRLNLNGDKLELVDDGVRTTSGRLPLNTWANVELHVVTAGLGASTVEVRLDGVLIYSSSTASLGASGVASIQIGNDTKKQAFGVVADNISAHGP